MKTKNKLRQARRTRSPLQHAARTHTLRVSSHTHVLNMTLNACTSVKRACKPRMRHSSLRTISAPVHQGITLSKRNEIFERKNVSRSAASYLIGWLIPSLNLSDRLAIPSLNHSSALKECDTHAINSERAKRERKYHRLRTKRNPHCEKENIVNC